MLDIGTVTHGFKLLRKEWIEEVTAEALVFTHEGTKAELVVLASEDDNKTFCITFRTPPADDTGLPHILEHSVLNGSAKYPVKEPFAELLKASLYTFLNAMTYPDKTVYPVASRNTQDFHNLMDVYLDAVFNPDLTEQTFMQEGWHYDIDSPDADLKFSGVVYNEMLGATSSPESVMVDKLETALFPDNIYGRNSGGDPEHIPELTYEQFVDFHRRYYHPSNSRIVLYGDFDIADRLKHLATFLDAHEFLDIDSRIQPHERLDEPIVCEATYPISTGAVTENKAYIMRAWLLDDPTDPELKLALTILARILAGTSASPLRKALIDSHLGEDVLAWFDSDVLDSYYTVGLKGADEDKQEEIISIIERTLASLAADGIDSRTIEASINSIEFRLREANYGGLSKGLIYALQMAGSWLYDADPLIMLKYEAPLAKVREGIAAGGYFERLIEKYLLNNNHMVTLTMTPDEEFEAKRLERLQKRLHTIKESMSEEQIAGHVKLCAELREAQLRPDSPEALATIPKLPLDCLEQKAETYPLEMVGETPKLTFAEQPTNGIAYLKVVFDANSIPDDLLPYLPMFSQVAMQGGTQNHSFVEMTEEIGIHTGGIGAGYSNMSIHGQPDAIRSFVAFSGKALTAKIPKMLEVLGEIFKEGRLDDLNRLQEIARVARAGMESRINGSGHGFAISRLSAGQTLAGKYGEITNGLEQFELLKQLVSDIESDPQSVINKLGRIREILLNAEGTCIHLTGGRDELAAVQEHLPALVACLPGTARPAVKHKFPTFGQNEGLIVPSKVQYVGKALNFYDIGMQYSGTFSVLAKLLSRDYLWNRVRVQGNAYGCFCDLDMLTGLFYCCSYRDPNLTETLSVFDEIADHLEDLQISQDEFEKVLIATVGSLDAPRSPDQKGAIAFNRHLSGISAEKVQADRDQTLACTIDDLKGYTGLFRKFATDGQICVVGGDEKVNAASDVFDTVQQPLA